MKMKQLVGSGVAGGSLVSLGAFAQATAPDVSAIVTLIGTAATAGAAIGVAVLSMHYGIKLYRWIKGAG
jgi:hypothetical protein